VAEPRREFIEGGSLETLLARLDGLTNVQSEPIMRAQEGKWAQAAGEVVNVSRNLDNVSVSILIRKPVRPVYLAWQIFLTFAKDHAGALVLGKEDIVTVQGRISTQTTADVALKDCEIIAHKSAGDIALENLKHQIVSLKEAADDWTSDPKRERAEVPSQRDVRKNVPPTEVEKFCKLLLEGWPKTKEREAHAKAVAFFPDNRVPVKPFLDLFRAIRGHRNPGPQPKIEN